MYRLRIVLLLLFAPFSLWIMTFGAPELILFLRCQLWTEIRRRPAGRFTALVLSVLNNAAP